MNLGFDDGAQNPKTETQRKRGEVGGLRMGEIKAECGDISPDWGPQIGARGTEPHSLPQR